MDRITFRDLSSILDSSSESLTTSSSISFFNLMSFDLLLSSEATLNEILTFLQSTAKFLIEINHSANHVLNIQ